MAGCVDSEEGFEGVIFEFFDYVFDDLFVFVVIDVDFVEFFVKSAFFEENNTGAGSVDASFVELDGVVCC